MKHVYYILLSFALLAFGPQTVEAQSIKGAMSSVIITSVNDSSIKVYPNPATSMITLTAQKNKVGYITINTIIGKQIRRVEASSDGRYDVSDLRRGLYIIRVFDKSDNLIKPLRLSKA